MSFSGEVKKELALKTGIPDHCRRAELAALFQCGGRLCTDSEGKKSIIFSSENAEIVKKCFTFLTKSYKIALLLPEEYLDDRNRTEYVLTVTDGESVERILSDLGFFENPEQLRRILEKPCCKRAYIRGLFLMNGSITDPAKGYHWELKVPGEQEAEQVLSILAEFGITPKQTTRKGQHYLYLKEGSETGDMLTLTEATNALLKFEEQRVLRETRGIINRRVNCECANLNKTLSASGKQIAGIEYIRDTVGFDSLPENLVELAELRLEHPTASLSELGEMLHPALGRSGVNHRLQKLMSIAEDFMRRMNQ